MNNFGDGIMGVQGFLYPTTTMSACVLSTIAFSSACSCAGTPNLSSMPQLLCFDIEANELGVYSMSTTLFDLSGRTAL
jgi:hypothetical protein